MQRIRRRRREAEELRRQRPTTEDYSVFLVIHGISLKMITMIIIRQSQAHANSGFCLTGGGSGISLKK